jgi:uncharacterized protein with PIN domain
VSRINEAFERRFRQLLGEFGARQIERGVAWLFVLAQKRAEERGTLSHSLAEENIALAEKLHRFRRRRGVSTRSAESLVFCDAGLGGLARWLRASGCDARWIPDIADADLVAKAEELNAIIITTDGPLLERRPIAHGRVRAIWVPPSLTKFEQLRLVRAELDLNPENESRCMRCGGELIRVDKESVKERIPPRTYKWIDEYFECARCHQLFWHGTHWQRVTKRLENNSSPKQKAEGPLCLQKGAGRAKTTGGHVENK